MFEPIGSFLRAHQQTVTVAESCTGGGLANHITSYAGVSDIFVGGVVAYANLAKEALLHVPHELIVQHGAVSEEVALAMASGCRDVFSSTWAVSTTGIAGPTGGSDDKPVGLVWIGVAGPHGTMARRFVFADVGRMEHRRVTIEQALGLLKEYVCR